MDPTMTAALKELLRNTVDNLTGDDFKRFKHRLRDQGQITWGKLEKADRDDTVELMAKVYSMGAGDNMLSILKKMNENQLAMYLEKDLERFDITAHSGGKVDTPALSEGRPMPQQGGVGAQQCFPSLAQGNTTATAYPEGMVRVQTGLIINGPVNFNLERSPLPQQEGEVCEQEQKAKGLINLHVKIPVPAAAPAKSPKKKAGPSVGDLIVKAVSASKETKGVSLSALKKALAAGGYDVEKNNTLVKSAVKSLLSKGTLVQTTGTGASGSFKLNKQAEVKQPVKKAAPKAKKPAAKKPPATKNPKKVVAKKPAAAKKSQKKAKKPAAPKKAAKSPKKAKAAKPKATKPKKAAPKKK